MDDNSTAIDFGIVERKTSIKISEILHPNLWKTPRNLTKMRENVKILRATDYGLRTTSKMIRNDSSGRRCL